MITWTMIVFVYAGALANGDSVALITVPGFTSEVACKEAGESAAHLDDSSTKVYRFACVKVH